MSKPVTLYIPLLGILLAGTVLGLFLYHNSQVNTTPQPLTVKASQEAVTRLSGNVAIDADTLENLDWPSLDEMLRIVVRNSEKTGLVMQIAPTIDNPAALYLLGLLHMINNKPQKALAVFNKLDIKEIPANFLYPVYRLHRQEASASDNRYLHKLRKALDSGNISPLIGARVEAQEGNLYSALSSYLKTDPAQWVTYDVKCIKKISQHAGLYSETLRLASGAVKSGRVSGQVEKSLRRLLSSKDYSEEISAFKKNLKNELKQDSNSGQIAVSSIKRMLADRTTFLQRDYQQLLSNHQNTNPLMVPSESVLMLFLSSVQLGNRLEMDRWGQEIKRRYPNREVVDWVSELITSIK